MRFSVGLTAVVTGLTFQAYAAQNQQENPQAFQPNPHFQSAQLKLSLNGDFDYPGRQVDQVKWADEETPLLKISSANGVEWITFSSTEKDIQPAFDKNKVFNALKNASKETVSKGFINDITSVQLVEGGVAFDYGRHRWQCAQEEKFQCAHTGPNSQEERDWPAGADIFGMMGPDNLVSPNGDYIASRQNNNVYIESATTREILFETKDGKKDYEYGNTLPTSWSGKIQVRLSDQTPPVEGIWSADSRYFLTFLTDSRHVGELAISRSIPDGDLKRRPDALIYKNALPLDEKTVQIKYVLLDTQDESIKVMDMPWLNAPIDPVRSRFLQWKDDSSQTFFFISHTRGADEITIWEGNAITGKVRKVRSEKSSTRAGVTGSNIQYGVEDIPGTDDYIWYSDKNGRGQFFRMNGRSGRVRNAISDSDVTALDIHYIDVDKSEVYFTAYPSPEVTDPDRIQLYKASLEAGEQERLTDTNTHHSIHFSPSGKHYIDIASRIDQPPTVYLRSIDGTASEIFVSSDDGWARPQKARPSRFEVLAADGKTKIYGNMYRPSYWSAQAKYPIINWIYGSAEYQVAGEGFDQRSSRLQHFAEAGFIVIELDSRGTPGRTKTFNDFGMGAGHNICGAQDHVAAMKQLAERDPTIDIRRPAVGGHSGGGQCAYRLALREPDFFKAAVISAPSSDPYILGAFYIEDFLGLIDEEDLFAEGARDPDLPKLSADVFIIQGEVDEDVPPASALRLVDQMIAQDKMFELLLIPNAGHSVYSDYVIRRVANFYAESLYGVSLMKNSQGLSQRD